MRKIIVGNWKMNPGSANAAATLITSIEKLARRATAEVVICPPMPFVSLASKLSVKLGAQDVSIEKNLGAFTGEVGALQLKSLGVSYAIVGHSERRARGETSAIVASKASVLLQSKISPIICIGEKERHHDGEHWSQISHQLHASVAGISRAQSVRCIIAYEPIWAIGKKAKGMMDSETISESAIFIKKILAEIFGAKQANKIRIIYGGSVDFKNAADIASASGISGCLVGRDSLNPVHFVKIAEAFK
jgi:triosephosphate isomerase